MRHVSLDALVFTGTGGFELAEGWEPVAIGPEGPVVASRTAGPTRHVAVAFALSDSNWPVDVSVTVFLQNALEYLVRATGEAALAFQPGDPVTALALPDAHELVIEGPTSVSVAATPGAAVTLPRLPQVGLYTVRGVAPPMDRVAVNLASDVESDLRPRRRLVVDAQAAEAGAVGDAAPLELWPVLAATALVLLILEWIVYALRTRG